MDALENAGRLKASDYRRGILYSTLSPCDMCSGAALLYRIPRIVIGENRTFRGPEDYVRSKGVTLEIADDPECVRLMEEFIRSSAKSCTENSHQSQAICLQRFQRGVPECRSPEASGILSADQRRLDPVHAAYVYIQQMSSYFAEGVSRLPELKPYSKLVSYVEDEYMPSGPPRISRLCPYGSLDS